MTLRSFLNRDRRRDDTEVPSRAHCQEARLEIRTEGDFTHFECSGPAMRFFSLRARLAGPMSISRSMSDDRVPSVRMTIPLVRGDRRLEVSTIFCSEDSSREWPLVAATLAPREQGMGLDYFFGNEKDRSVYTFLVPGQTEIEGFEPVERKLLASAAPSVAQLGAVLRATLLDRRDVLTIMEDLVATLSAASARKVATLREKLGTRLSLQTQAVQWLQEDLGDQRTGFGSGVTTALALLLDMEMERITADDVGLVGEGRRRLETSWEALVQVARLHGKVLDPSEWQERFVRAGLPFPEVPDAEPDPALKAALLKMLGRLKRRDPLAVLGNLVRESPGARIEQAWKAWKALDVTVPTDRLEGLEAYREFLGLHERRVGIDTLMAICLYAEIESGLLTVDEFEEWLKGERRVGLSPAAMQAVGSAFDLELLALSLPRPLGGGEDMVDDFLGVSQGKVLQGLRNLDQPVRTFRLLQAGQEVAPMPGWEPSGEYVFCTTTVDRLTPEEVRLFLDMGNQFLACFQADVDRRKLWRRLSLDVVGEGTDLTFVEGFRIYHFQNRIVAWVEEGRPGGEPSRSPDLYRDHRGRLHYHHPERPPVEETSLEKTSLCLVFPAIDTLPGLLLEIAPERVAPGGAGSSGPGRDESRLEILHQALRVVLARRPELGPALSDRGLTAIIKQFEHPRVKPEVHRFVDEATIEGLLKRFLDPRRPTFEYRLYEPLVQGLRYPELLDFVSLGLIYELSGNRFVQEAGYLRNFPRPLFRASLRNRVLAMLESKHAEVRQHACCLMATSACVGAEAERAVVAYELTKQLDAPEPQVVTEASRSLARLGLEKVLPIPTLWDCTLPADRGGGPKRDETVQAEFAKLAQEVRDWEMHVHAMLRGSTYAPEGRAPVGVARGVRDLGWLLARARSGLRLERNEGRASRGRIFLLVTDDGLLRLLIRFLASWDSFAHSRGITLDEVARRLPGRETLEEYRLYVGGNPEFGWVYWPLDQATGEPVPWFGCREVWLPEPLWVLRESPEAILVNPIFSALVQKALEKGPERVRLCRFRQAATTRPDLPAPFDLEVFNLAQGEFLPFLHEMRAAARVSVGGSHSDFLEALAAMRYVMSRFDPFELVAPHGEPYEDESLVGADSPPEDQRLMLLVTRQLLEFFGLSEGYLAQVIKILQDLRRPGGS